MSGSGSGGPFGPSRPPEELHRLVRQAEDKTSGAEFESELSKTLGDLLANYNDRDIDKVRDRLDDLKQALEGEIEGTLDQIYGGSVAKHSYVDGLSDIDSILIINGTDLEGVPPRDVLDKIYGHLEDNYTADVEITAGNMAVTVDFKDGMSVQLLPALSTDKGLKIPSVRHEGWSSINPQTFQAALTQRNEECGGKLVPVVKLAKAVISTLPESQRLTGYHVESIAIAAFHKYDGAKTTVAMLPTFFDKAKEIVKSPIKDSTGQSVNVDNYLGAENSTQRLSASHVLDRLARRMTNATAAGSRTQWLAMFDTDF